MDENLIIFIFLIFFSTIPYCYANFYAKIKGADHNFFNILLVALGFALIEYLIRVPAIYYYGKKVNSILAYTIILISTFISLTLYSKYVLNETIPTSTYITIFLIILILIINSCILN